MHGSENPNLMPKGEHHRALPLGRRLGRHHHRQEPGDDAVRPARLPHQGQPEVRLGEEGAADDLLPVGGAGADPHQLRVLLRRRRALARPQRLPPHQRRSPASRRAASSSCRATRRRPRRSGARFRRPSRRRSSSRKIRLFDLDAFKIAREEATDPELQLRMQGIAFQGAFFAASPLMEQAGLDEATLIEAIRAQLQHKFGAKGARVVEDNMRVVRRGFDELMPVEAAGRSRRRRRASGSPAASRRSRSWCRALPQSATPISDIHRFWEQTGNFYVRGMGNDNLTDPFIGLGVMPASSALFRDMTAIRFEHPEWVPENCTACGKCYTVCPDTAIPGLVTEVCAGLRHGDQARRASTATSSSTCRAPRDRSRRSSRSCSPRRKRRIRSRSSLDAGDRRDARRQLAGRRGARAAHGRARRLPPGARRASSSRSRAPTSRSPRRSRRASGGLLSITVNPYTCKGCMECVAVCNDDALRPVTQTEDSVGAPAPRVGPLARPADDAEALPAHRRPRAGDRRAGDPAARQEQLPRLRERRRRLPRLLGEDDRPPLHRHGRGADAAARRAARREARRPDRAARAPRPAAPDLGPPARRRCGGRQRGRRARRRRPHPRRARRAARTGRRRAADRPGLAEADERADGEAARPALALRRGRARGAAARAWAWSTRPAAPRSGARPIPSTPTPSRGPTISSRTRRRWRWASSRGTWRSMADGFRDVRRAELELDGGGWEPALHDEALHLLRLARRSPTRSGSSARRSSRSAATARCTTSASRTCRALMASGKPIKVLVVDTQVYSNTGGQACTSGFIGQVSDMAQYGRSWKGKPEPRKEIGLIGMAHRTTYVMQSTIAYPSHMIEGFIRGLKARRPALFNLYSSCQPEHGIGDDMSEKQARLVVESRAYPLFRYDPAGGATPAECFDLDGNPAADQLWPIYTLRYREGESEKTMEVPMTFADFAITEARFRKHYRTAPPDTWHEGDGAARRLPRAGAGGPRRASSPTSGRSTASSSSRASSSTARWSSRARTAATSGACCAPSRAPARRRSRARRSKPRCGATSPASSPPGCCRWWGIEARMALRLLGLKTFRHGVHPPEAKEETRDLAIRQFPFAPLLVVPLAAARRQAGDRGRARGAGGAARRAPGASRRLHVGRHARSRLRGRAADRARAEHQRADGAGGLPRALPGLDAGGPGRRPLRSRHRDAGGDPRRDPAGRHRRPRRRRLPDPRQARRCRRGSRSTR